MLIRRRTQKYKISGLLIECLKCFRIYLTGGYIGGDAKYAILIGVKRDFTTKSAKLFSQRNTKEFYVELLKVFQLLIGRDE